MTYDHSVHFRGDRAGMKALNAALGELIAAVRSARDHELDPRSTRTQAPLSWPTPSSSELEYNLSVNDTGN